MEWINRHKENKYKGKWEKRRGGGSEKDHYVCKVREEKVYTAKVQGRGKRMLRKIEERKRERAGGSERAYFVCRGREEKV